MVLGSQEAAEELGSWGTGGMMRGAGVVGKGWRAAAPDPCKAIRLPEAAYDPPPNDYAFSRDEQFSHVYRLRNEPAVAVFQRRHENMILPCSTERPTSARRASGSVARARVASSSSAPHVTWNRPCRLHARRCESTGAFSGCPGVTLTDGSSATCELGWPCKGNR